MRLINHPILCNYYVTYRCNAKCGFCDIWEKPSPYVSMEQVEQNLKDLKKLGVKVIDFTGGEPLLHREIDEMLRLAKRMKFITTLTTNCLLYPKWAEKIKGQVDMLHFSLDSANRETHDQMRGTPCFDKVMESIELARSLKERPDILFTVFEHNIEEVEDVYRNICLKYDLVLILNPVFSYNEIDSEQKLSARSIETLRAWGRKKNVYVNDAFLDLRLNGGNHISDPVCKAASSTVVIGPDNNLILPCYHLGKHDLPIEGNLYGLYRGSEVQKLIEEEGKLPECEGCDINCYMQPSFAIELNQYWWKALRSTLKYNFIKGTWKELIKV